MRFGALFLCGNVVSASLLSGDRIELPRAYIKGSQHNSGKRSPTPTQSLSANNGAPIAPDHHHHHINAAKRSEPRGLNRSQRRALRKRKPATANGRPIWVRKRQATEPPAFDDSQIEGPPAIVEMQKAIILAMWRKQNDPDNTSDEVVQAQVTEAMNKALETEDIYTVSAALQQLGIPASTNEEDIPIEEVQVIAGDDNIPHPTDSFILLVLTETPLEGGEGDLAPPAEGEAPAPPAEGEAPAAIEKRGIVAAVPFVFGGLWFMLPAVILVAAVAAVAIYNRELTAEDAPPPANEHCEKGNLDVEQCLDDFSPDMIEDNPCLRTDSVQQCLEKMYPNDFQSFIIAEEDMTIEDPEERKDKQLEESQRCHIDIEKVGMELAFSLINNVMTLNNPPLETEVEEITE